MFIDSYNAIFKDKSKILFVFSHPDDAEIYAGGTIARLVKDQREVMVVKMSLGNKGSRDLKITEEELSKQRYDEDVKAMQTLGIKSSNNIYLKFKDGEIENGHKTIEELVRIIRTFKPDIVVTHNPEDMIIRWSEGVNWVNHRDHRNTGKSVVDACYPFSRDNLFFPHHLYNEGGSCHTVTEFLFVDYYNHEDTLAIDVTDYVDVRTKAIACHSSQYPLEKAQSSTDFFTKLDDSGKRFERFRHVVAD